MRGLPGTFRTSECGEERHDLLPERRNITVHDYPDLIGIHAEVCMDQNIPEANDLRPGDPGGGASEVRGKACSCFPDYLEMMHHPDLH